MPASDFYSQTLSHWVKSNRLVANVSLALLYVCFAQYGYIVANVDHLISPFWPPFGLVIASAFLARRLLLPGIFIGAGIAQYLAGNQVHSSIVIASGVTLSAYSAYWLLSYITQFKSILGRVTTPVWIVGASLLAPTISATTGVFTLFALEPTTPNASYMTVWFTWWMGDTIGALIIAPVIMSLTPVKLSGLWLLRLALLATLSGLTFSLIFLEGADSTPMLFLAFPILLIACHWFGPAGSAWSTLTFVFFAITSIVFLEQAPTASTFHGSVLLFDFFVFALATTSLTISAFYHKEYFFFPAMLFLVGWTFCGWAHFTLKRNAQELDKVRFIEIASEAEQSLQHRLATYIDALRASAAYYMNSKVMQREEWRNYVTFVKIDKHHPGINGLGFIQPFTTQELDEYVKNTRANELPDFTIRQVVDGTPPQLDELGDSHYIITHIEPIEHNLKALGLDVASESNRRFAAQKARDSGKAIMTDRINLVQDGESRPGFLIYLPIYKPNAPTETIEQRREAFIGWAYAPFITQLFLEGVLGQRSSQIQFTIYDDPAMTANNVVYSTTNKHTESAPTEFDYVSSLNLAEQIFSFEWTRGPGFQAQQTHSATIAAASLALGTCFLVGIVVSLQSTNRRVNSIVDRKTAELIQTNKYLQKEVSDRKHAEAEAEEAKRAAEEANHAKSEFLATMSHEIRTPMNSVIGFSELLATSKLDGDQTLWTSYIQNSGNSLLHIINDILDLSKIDAGKLELENIPLSIEELVNETIGSFLTIANEKGILLDAYKDNDIPPLVKGDPVRLKQILTNLISNAIKFTPHGGITINMHWEGNEKDGVITLRVTDTGIGILKEKQQTLFDKFTQVDSSTTREYGGTGLGLAICKNLCNLMNGDIQVTSVPNQGTTMTVTVPCERIEAVDNKSTSAASSSTSSKLITNKSPLKVLLVDDNGVNQKLGLTILRRLGCDVSVADNGVEAVEKVKRDTPSIIFMDCQMPIMDGYDATKSIRELEKSGQVSRPENSEQITIIALTANSSANDREVCLNAGMNDYLRKPCSIKDFKQMLKTYSNS